MTRQGRAEIIGQYPTAGAGGSRVLFVMPGPEGLLLPVGRPLDAEGNIIIEGTGVAPTIHVPVTEETLFSEDDVLMDVATAVLMGDDLPYGSGPNTEPGQPVQADMPSSDAASDAAGGSTDDATQVETSTETVTATEQVTATGRVTVTLGTPSNNGGGNTTKP